MRVLTVKAPWAPLIAAGVKQVETRPSRLSTYRGPVAVHTAARAADRYDVPGMVPADVLAASEAALAEHELDVHLGHIVAVVDLVDVVHTERLSWCDPDTASGPGDLHWWTDPQAGVSIHECERLLGIYGPDRWAWLLARPRPLAEPIPLRGRQGLRNLPHEVAELVRDQLEVWP